jgi:GNAT superfamily N-acetyltransferase
MTSCFSGQIRPAATSDADEIARLHIASWRVAYRGLLPDSMLANVSSEDRTAMWRQIITARSATTLVAESDGEIAAFIHICPSRDEDLDTEAFDEIAVLYVEPRRWRIGIGTARLARFDIFGHRRTLSKTDRVESPFHPNVAQEKSSW